MKSLAIALMMATLAIPGAAMARDHDDHNDHGRDRGGEHDSGHGGPPAGYQGRGAPQGGYRQGPPPSYGGPVPSGYRSAYPPPRAYGGPPPYAGQPRYRDPGDWNEYRPTTERGQRWRRGQMLPQSYRGEVVGDYSRYHLRRPPPGYYWYRSGDDYVLAAIATGLIFEVVTGDGGY